MSDFDPVEFGRMQAELQALRRDYEAQGKTIEKMARQVEELLAMANQGKGGLWMFRGAYTVAGGFLVWLAERYLR